jgi:hypothetical protein
VSVHSGQLLGLTCSLVMPTFGVGESLDRDGIKYTVCYGVPIAFNFDIGINVTYIVGVFSSVKGTQIHRSGLLYPDQGFPIETERACCFVGQSVRCLIDGTRQAQTDDWQLNYPERQTV